MQREFNLEEADYYEPLPVSLMFVNTKREKVDDGILVYLVKDDELNNFKPQYILIGKTTDECWKIFADVPSGSKFTVADAKCEKSR